MILFFLTFETNLSYFSVPNLQTIDLFLGLLFNYFKLDLGENYENTEGVGGGV